MAHSLQISSLFDVKDRWIAITGAASGIGAMLSRGFAANGANTILVDINKEALTTTKQELEGVAASAGFASAKVLTFHGDLGSESGTQALADSIKSSVDSIDALFHCAAVRFMNKTAYTQGDSLEALEAATLSASYKDWEKTFRVNVLGPYYLTAGLIGPLGKAAARGEGRGSVVLFSSPASVHNNQFVPSYQTSKAAIDHLVRVMAAEFASFYIRVNAMSPGIVPSALTPDDGVSNLHRAGETPARRPGNEDDMVGCALWLVSKAGAFMDGKVVRIEGGRLLTLKGVTINSD